jgi:hypothetical protein
MLPIPDELIDHLCTGSDSQIDASIKPNLQKLKGRTDDAVKDEVLEIIGDCISYDLCSGFVLSILQCVFYVDCCSGKIEDAVGRIRVTPLTEAKP